MMSLPTRFQSLARPRSSARFAMPSLGRFAIVGAPWSPTRASYKLASLPDDARRLLQPVRAWMLLSVGAWWPWVVVLISGLLHGYNMLNFPYYENDEGTYEASPSFRGIGLDRRGDNAASRHETGRLLLFRVLLKCASSGLTRPTVRLSHRRTEKCARTRGDD